jgi:uridine kinase
MTRAELHDALAERIASLRPPHPARVAIDGVDASGKTTLADELVGPVESRGRTVLRASIDHFHRPSADRYRRGRGSPEGYFRDSFDHESLERRLLVPLGPGGSRRIRRRAFDHRSNRPVDAPEEEAPADAVLLFDGIFLHRPELVGHWELSIFLRCPFEVSVARAATRDGGCADPGDPSNRRYVEGQRLYLRECEPERLADLVVDNSRLGEPRWVGAPSVESSR